MKAFMLSICLFFSQLTYGSPDGVSEKQKEMKHPVTVVATVPAYLKRVANIDADERIRRLEQIANDLEKRVKSLEEKVEKVGKTKDPKH